MASENERYIFQERAVSIISYHCFFNGVLASLQRNFHINASFLYGDFLCTFWEFTKEMLCSCMKLRISGNLTKRYLLLERLYKGAMASSCKKERKKETKPKICTSFQLFQFVIMGLEDNPETETETFSCSTAVVIVFLTVNTISGAIRACHDLRTMSFIISVNVLLMLLYWCLHVGEKLPEDSKERERLRVPVWLLATALNLMFAYRISFLLSLGFSLFVWTLALLCCFSTFYLFFIYKGSPDHDEYDLTSIEDGYYCKKASIYKIGKIHDPYQSVPFSLVEEGGEPKKTKHTELLPGIV